MVQTPAGTGGGRTPGSSEATRHRVVHEPPAPKPVTSGHHAKPAAEYNLQLIEPGIQNHKVEVYRSKDAQETVYNGTIPQDHGDFHLIVVGIRNPDYSHDGKRTARPTAPALQKTLLPTLSRPPQLRGTGFSFWQLGCAGLRPTA